MVSNKIEYMRSYYAKNPDKYNKYFNETVYCNCCIKDVKKCIWNRHIKSNKHQQRSLLTTEIVELEKQLKELRQKTSL
jgi:hypothetical protein